MIYGFDLDNTLCVTERGDYKNATPIKERIEQVNKLFEQGHFIKIDTARGSVTGEDWLSLTKEQLNDWGVKYHEVRVGFKPFCDVYVGDEAINDKDFFHDSRSK